MVRSKKTLRNEHNSMQIISESTAQARNTRSNAPEPPRIVWGAQIGPRAEILETRIEEGLSRLSACGVEALEQAKPTTLLGVDTE